jgi:predicted RNase H-like nuclease (RuvC/YqgF family)
MSGVILSMKLSPKATGALFSKACRLEEENKRLQARVVELKADGWLLRQKADVIEECMHDIHRLRSAFNLSEDETMGIKMAIQHCKGEVRNLRLAADEADKEQES